MIKETLLAQSYELSRDVAERHIAVVGEVNDEQSYRVDHPESKAELRLRLFFEKLYTATRTPDMLVFVKIDMKDEQSQEQEITVFRDAEPDLYENSFGLSFAHSLVAAREFKAWNVKIEACKYRANTVLVGELLVPTIIIPQTENTLQIVSRESALND